MQIENLIIELEKRNDFLIKKMEELKEEQSKYSKQSSNIQFIRTGMKGEIEANKLTIKRIKGQKS